MSLISDIWRFKKNLEIPDKVCFSLIFLFALLKLILYDEYFYSCFILVNIYYLSGFRECELLT